MYVVEFTLDFDRSLNADFGIIVACHSVQRQKALRHHKAAVGLRISGLLIQYL